MKSDEKYIKKTSNLLWSICIKKNSKGVNDADKLRYQPPFTNIPGKQTSASQPTISKFNNRVTMEALNSYQHINEILQDKNYLLSMPEPTLLDILSP